MGGDACPVLEKVKEECLGVSERYSETGKRRQLPKGSEIPDKFRPRGVMIWCLNENK